MHDQEVNCRSLHNGVSIALHFVWQVCSGFEPINPTVLIHMYTYMDYLQCFLSERKAVYLHDGMIYIPSILRSRMPDQPLTPRIAFTATAVVVSVAGACI